MKTIMIAVMASFMAVGLYATVRFTDNDDGTVTDHGTGLVWQKCSSGQGATDCSGSATTANWQGALQYCRNLTLDGRSWRLPSVNELKSIVDYSRYNPTVNTVVFPNTQASHYWSSSTTVDYADGAWDVNFYSGNVDTPDGKSVAYYVRCVTDGP